MKSTSILNSVIYAARPKMINKHIEIVSSTVNGLSSMGQQSRQAIYDVLSKYYATVGITIVNTLSDLEELAALKPDLVFLGMRYIPIDLSEPRGPKRIWLSAYLDERDIACTGSGQTAHHLELNKALAKQSIKQAGLNTPAFYVAKQNLPGAKHTALSFPLFVKPTDRGGGQGIDSSSLVRNPIALQSKIDNISANLQADSLVEEYLPGREFSVAILKSEFSDELLSLPLELIAPLDESGARILSGRVKRSDTEQTILATDVIIKNRVIDLAIKVFHALGARDYGRIDIRLDKSGTPHFIEANLIPSLINGYGNFPKACQMNIKLDYEEMILAIVALGLKRSYRMPRLNMLVAEPDEVLSTRLAGTINR